MKIKNTPWWDHFYSEMTAEDKRWLKNFYKAQDEAYKRVEARAIAEGTYKPDGGGAA